jgi:uncharacterized membrane protein YfcA
MQSEIVLILAGAAAGGFVNGLTGFGTALTAMPFWLYAMPPPLAAQLAAAAGIIGQVQTLPAIWHAIVWRRVAPFIVAGLAGVPLGTWLLPHVGIRSFKLGVGLVLVGYCAFLLLAQSRRSMLPAATAPTETPAADAAVGFCGGVLGGLAGLSGPLPTIWATFKPWSKDDKRALFQAFNVTILSAMLLSSAIAGLMPAEIWLALALALPGTIVGVRLGAMVYRRIDDRRFDRLVLALLMIAGMSLIVGNL